MKASQLRELIRELIQGHLDEMSTTGALVQPGGQQIATTKAFTSMRDWKKVNKNRKWEESINESYRKFKKKVTNPRQQMNNSVREIEKHLREVDRIVEYNLKLKTEMDLGGGNFFEGTNKRLARISERINHLNNKLKELGN
jgi:septation ring formation regulator EzrA